MGKVYVALIHHPVYNKRKEIVSTCITGFDLHDIARSALTFGVSKYFVVNPMAGKVKRVSLTIGQGLRLLSLSN